jgi:hypothetical protein
MADTTTQEVGIPIGTNKSLVTGTLITNKNGDTEWYQGTGTNKALLPTFASNKSNNYQWEPSPNCAGIFGTGSSCPTEQQRTNFYSNTASTNTLNNARLNTFNSAGGFNSPQLAKQLKIPGATNTAPDPTGGSSAPGGTPPAPTLPGPGEQPQTAELTNIDVAGGRGSSGLRYPKLMKTDQDKIKFQACKISRSSSSITSSPKYETVDGPVVLAIQSPISDQNSVDWGPDSVNAIEAKVFDAARNAITSKNLFPALENALKDAYGDVYDNQGRIQSFLAGQAAGLNNVLARTDNVVLNPNLELLFQGPQLRPFSFTFKMSARSQPEANEIKSIIKYFKYHMAVRKEQGLFLRAPHVFTIQYMKGEVPQHPGINLISPTDDTKACALTNCSVDYTPLGSYATYEDGTMVAYTLSLQFQEITPIYDTDYKDYPHEIGF